MYASWLDTVESPTLRVFPPIPGICVISWSSSTPFCFKDHLMSSYMNRIPQLPKLTVVQWPDQGSHEAKPCPDPSVHITLLHIHQHPPPRWFPAIPNRSAVLSSHSSKALVFPVLWVIQHQTIQESSPVSAHKSNVIMRIRPLVRLVPGVRAPTLSNVRLSAADKSSFAGTFSFTWAHLLLDFWINDVS